MKKKKGWGGAREGSGPKPKHTDPNIKERTKKLRATDEEWREFLDFLPGDSREDFDLLLELLRKTNRGKVG